ncbi:tRNA(His) guanylyltransferase 1-like protein isoform X1, partial [Tanacetum coccineum]
FCELNGFEKPNDIKAQNLINACAVAVCKECPDIILAYGFGDEYSFIFKRDTDHFSRRASKLLSVIVSLFTSSYGMKWIEFFPHKDMRSSALFEGEVLCLKASTDIQAYLATNKKNVSKLPTDNSTRGGKFAFLSMGRVTIYTLYPNIYQWAGLPEN